MVIPSGSPSWERAASIETVGGHEDKQNIEGLSAFNPKTQLSAEQFSSLVDYVVAAQRVIPFAVLNVTTNDTSPADPTANSYFAQSGNGVSNAPTLTRVDDGRFTADFSGSYLDSYSQAGAFSVSALKLTINDASAPRFYTATIVSSTQIEIEIFDDASGVTRSQDVRVTLEVW